MSPSGEASGPAGPADGRLGDPPRDPLTLVSRSAARDVGAVREMVRRLIPVLRGTVSRRMAKGGSGPAEVDDHTQELWLWLCADDYRRLRRFDPTQGIAFESYVAMISDRELTSILRKKRAQKRGSGKVSPDSDALRDAPAQDASPEDNAAARLDLRAMVAHLRNTLPPRGFLVFRYLYTDGREVTETAEIMGVKPQVVYNWQHRIRKEARSFMATQGGDPRKSGSPDANNSQRAASSPR